MTARGGGDRAGRWAAAFMGTSLAWVIVVTVIAGNLSLASPHRFLLVCLTCGIVPAGLAGTVLSLRRSRSQRLLRHFAGATGAMRDTMQFLLHERRLSQRGRLTLLIGAWAGLALGILSAWPQCAAIAHLRPAFHVTAAACVVLLILQPFYVRSHIVNAIYLRRYLRQQAEHIGFRPKQERGVKPDASQTIVIGEGGFRVGDFDFTHDDLYKNALIFGAPGSGKTVCVLNPFLEGLIGSTHDGLCSGGIVFDPKGAFDGKIQAVCERLGRADDLHVLSAEKWAEHARTAASIALNPLDTGDPAADVAQRIVVSMKVAGGLETRDTFFLDAARHFIRHSFTLYRTALAPDPASLLDLQRLCAETASEPVEYERLVGILHRRFPGGAPPEIEAAIQYMETDWLPLPDKQRAGVRSTVNQLVDDFTSQPFAEVISGRSTITIADLIDQGRILYVHLPLAGSERLAPIFTNLIKLEFQREILRRVGKARPTFMLADEYQTIFTSGQEHADTTFFEASRESRHCNVVAAQNLSSFLKKTANRSDVTNFFGLFAVKVFLRNTESETNEWASKLFGERSEIVVTMSEAAGIDGWFSRNQTNYSRSTRALRVVPPEAFVALPIPVAGDPSRHFTGAIVHLASRDTVEKLELDLPIHRLAP